MRASYRPSGMRKSPPLRLISKRLWMRDAECAQCQQCHEPFTFFRRRHHCRYCGKGAHRLRD